MIQTTPVFHGIDGDSFLIDAEIETLIARYEANVIKIMRKIQEQRKKQEKGNA